MLKPNSGYYGDLFLLLPSDTIPAIKYVADTSFNQKGDRTALCVLRNNQLLVIPKQLKAQGLNSSEIQITWYDSTTGEQQFYIERSTDGINNWVRIDSVPANSTAYKDHALQANTTYYYRIRSAVPWFVSAPSNIAFAATKQLGISSFNTPKVYIYPNPFTQEFTLDLGASQAISIQVISTDGKQISQPLCNHCSGKQTINLKGQASGIYYIKVRFANNNESTFEVIKE